jgi:hypothetical protein
MNGYFGNAVGCCISAGGFYVNDCIHEGLGFEV